MVPRGHAVAAALLAAFGAAAIAAAHHVGVIGPQTADNMTGLLALCITSVLGQGRLAQRTDGVRDDLHREIAYRLNGGLKEAINQALNTPTDLVGHVHPVESIDRTGPPQEGP